MSFCDSRTVNQKYTMIDLETVQMVNQLKECYPCSTERVDSTVQHNMLVGGAPKSLHLQGKAFDLTFDHIEDLIPAAQYAIKLGFGGVEVDLKNLHLHVDTRDEKWHVVHTSGGMIAFDIYLTGHSG